ncbi:hypothetical protein CAEBREN_29758 [Caenorhabditis brenneri]|uniref:Doublecortin domain-containing protein n=1 Tax=Caenorhabditis brenneri TaxID=135651 RepID=G0P6B3_CAEBE|nr:hypothetical protein CAEBREN_29758 [Caenorhabditis brenneri]
MSENLHTIIHHVDFFPLRIRVFRNGDMFDQGRILVVTRKQFKHWIVFLDALTAMLRTATAVRRLFTIQGIPVHHVSHTINTLIKWHFQFDELETNGEYVAVETGPFISVPYGQTRFTLRGKRYNPIIRAPQLIPTFLNSAESMDIYLKKEGYGTITGLPYPFDGILSRSPSASNIQIKHLQSHIPPLKIGGSMEHLNELGTASWLGKNEKWMMGERVRVETQTTKNEERIPKLEIKDVDGGSTTSEVVKNGGMGDKSKSTSNTKLPRLMNSNRSFKRDSSQKPTSDEPRQAPENLPPIDLKSVQNFQQTQNTIHQKDSDTISIKTEEEVISILKPEKTTTESMISSKISRKNAPKEDDEVRFHRSYQVTETTYTTRNSDEMDQEKQQFQKGDNSEKQESRVVEKAEKQEQRFEKSEKSEKPPAPQKPVEKPEKSSQKTEKSEKKERANWSDQASLKREKSIEKSGKSLKISDKREKSVDRTVDKLMSDKFDKFENSERKPAPMTRRADMAKGELRKFDVDINEIPIRFEGSNTNGIGGRTGSKIVTSRSSMHLFVDEVVGEDELDDVIERAQLWDMNRRRQQMRQRQTQTSASMCRSISAPRRRVVLFDPDFD